MKLITRFMRFPGGLGKAATLSYDDGCAADVRFSDVITSHGIKCTFNFNSDKLREEEALPESVVREKILDRGHEIAVHGEFHRASGLVRPIECIKEVLNCRLELEQRYGIIIRGMAYPDSGITHITYPNTYEGIRKNLQDLDIAYARTLAGDNDKFRLPEDFYAWMPNVHHTNPEALEYIDKFNAIDPFAPGWYPRNFSRLFYMWGHSYEFDRDNNWAYLEEICRRLGGKSDVWYATNMEICEYVKAYNSLVYSADERIIYNPTVTRVWFEIDRVGYSIGPGETLRID